MEEKRQTVTAVILMAGSGKRMHTEEKKQFLPFQGKPLFYASVERFLAWERCKELLLIVGAEDQERVEAMIETEGWRTKKNVRAIKGGEERFDSVYRAISYMEGEKQKENAVPAQAEDTVFIHDAARPFFTVDLLERLYRESRIAKAVIPGLPVKDTIKLVEDGVVRESLERNLLYSIQTPQAFTFPLLLSAYQKFLAERDLYKKKITDDAMVIELFSEEKVKLVPGEEKNQKITVQEDIELLYN